MSLDYFTAHPLRIKQKKAALPISAVLAAEAAHCATRPAIHPHVGAYIHYGGVELADRITMVHPNLTPAQWADLCALWNQSCGVVCRQLLFYTWKIIAKEQRHGNYKMALKAFGGDADKWTPGQHIVAKINTSGEFNETLAANGAVPVGDYLKAVVQHYNTGGWTGAFGGKKWGFIAEQVLKYFNGELSAMLAADRMWTLVHNTGPIFNKGFYFKHHGSDLMPVLEAQAHGSVFQYSKISAKNNPELIHPFTKFVSQAVSAIQTVQPDFKLATPGDFPDTEPDNTTTPGMQVHTTNLGPIPLTLQTREA